MSNDELAMQSRPDATHSTAIARNEGRARDLGRSLALDALRGLALVGMCLSGVVPFGVLPPWMYHAQEPPPTHAFRPDIAGLTWVDLVFPIFLFSMGAALPLALTPRIERGESAWRLALVALRRAIVLAFFALYGQAIQPYLLAREPDARAFGLALLGFLLLVPIFTRLPARWSRTVRVAVRGIGLCAAIVFMLVLRYPDGSGFRKERVDIILLVLANVVFFASVVWLWTRRRPLVRLCVLAGLFALFETAKHVGAVEVLTRSPIPWLYRFDFLKYAFIVVPATYAGEWLLHERRSLSIAGRWTSRRALLLATLLGLEVVAALVCLQARAGFVWIAILAMFACVTWRLVANARSPAEELARRLALFAIPWTFLGAACEPFVGGIHKDPANYSYYFTTLGLSLSLLSAFVLVADVAKIERPLRGLAENGQNPMLGYVAIRNVLAPVWGLSGIGVLLAGVLHSPWLGFVHALVKTAALAAFVAFCTRRKIVWRS